MRKMEFRTLRGNQVDKTSRWGGNDVVSKKTLHLSGSPAGYWTWFHLVSFTGHQISDIVCVRMSNRWHTMGFKVPPMQTNVTLDPRTQVLCEPKCHWPFPQHQRRGTAWRPQTLQDSRFREQQSVPDDELEIWRNLLKNLWRIVLFFWLKLFWKIAMIKNGRNYNKDRS